MTVPKILAYELTVPVRWADMDVNAHVNNVCFFTYFECARLAWLEQVRTRGARNGQGGVVKHQTCNYLRPIPYPETVLIQLYAGPPGRTSFTTYYELHSEKDPLIKYGDGNAVMVWVDRASGKPQPLPEYMRAVLAPVADHAGHHKK
jgi:acyl-CoA thioester hydrolase